MNVNKVYDSEVESNLRKVDVLLNSFKISYEHGDPDGAAASLYYACFHAVSALFVKIGKPIRTHKGLNIEFGKFLRENNLSENHVSIFSKLATVRELAHYNLQKDVDVPTLESLVKPAYELIELIKTLCIEK